MSERRAVRKAKKEFGRPQNIPEGIIVFVLKDKLSLSTTCPKDAHTHTLARMAASPSYFVSVLVSHQQVAPESGSWGVRQGVGVAWLVISDRHSCSFPPTGSFFPLC